MGALERTVLYTKYALYVTFALSIIGIQSQSTLQAAVMLESVYKLLVGVILVIFANPYADLPKEFLKQLAFSAGILIIASSSLSPLILDHLGLSRLKPSSS